MSQNEEPSATAKNRRFGVRRKPRPLARVSCTTAQARANLALALLDVSRSGARLLIRSELAKGLEVAIGLPWPGKPRQDALRATVVWCVAAAIGGYCVGVQFHRLLSEEDLRLVVENTETGSIPATFPLTAHPANQ
jgi:hypothetical protein